MMKQTRFNNEKGEIVLLQIERLTEIFVRKGKEIEIGWHIIPFTYPIR